MNRLWWAGAALVGALAGCSRSASSPSARVLPATQTVMAQQVRNAVYAGDGDVLAQAWRNRIARNPADLEARLALAAHYEQQGYSDIALEHYRLAAERFPDHPDVALRLAQSLDQMGETRLAAEGLDQFLRTHPPTSAQAPAWLGLLRDKLGDHAAAEPAHRAALALTPSNAKLYNNLGFNLWRQNKRQEAVAAFRRALALDPKLDAAHNNLGMALLSSGDTSQMREAIGHFEAAADPAAAHNNAAAILLEQGLYAQARQELELALRHRAGYAPALWNLELLSRLDGKPAALPQAGREQPGENWLSRFWRTLLGVEQKPPSVGAPLAEKR